MDFTPENTQAMNERNNLPQDTEEVMDELKNDIKDWYKTLKKTRHQLQNLKKEHQQKINEKQAEYRALGEREQNKKNETHRSQLKVEIQEIRKKVEQVITQEKQTDAVVKNIAKILDRTNYAEKTHKEQINKMSEIGVPNQSLSAEGDESAKNPMQPIEQKISNITEEVDGIRGKQRDINVENEQMLGELESANARLQNLPEEIKKAIDDASNYTPGADEAGDKYFQYIEQAENLAEEKGRLESKVTYLEQLIQSNEEKIQYLQDLKKSQRNRLRQLRDALDDAKQLN